MTGKQRDRVLALERRRDRLAERVSGYRSDGHPDRARAELGAINWALRVIAAAEREGILADLEAVAA